MTTKADISKVILALNTSYPGQAIGKGLDAQGQAVKIAEVAGAWFQILGDLPYTALSLGIRAISATSREFFPPVGVVRQAALEFADPQMIQDAADRLMAEKLRISWRCCPTCQYGPMVHGHCPRCTGKIETEVEATEVPQLEGER